MAAQLGNVLFWLGIIIGIGIWLFAVQFDDPEFLQAATVISIACAGIGWALRYILGGGNKK